MADIAETLTLAELDRAKHCYSTVPSTETTPVSIGMLLRYIEAARQGLAAKALAEAAERADTAYKDGDRDDLSFEMGKLRTAAAAFRAATSAREAKPKALAERIEEAGRAPVADGPLPADRVKESKTARSKLEEMLAHNDSVPAHALRPLLETIIARLENHAVQVADLRRDLANTASILRSVLMGHRAGWDSRDEQALDDIVARYAIAARHAEPQR